MRQFKNMRLVCLVGMYKFYYTWSYYLLLSELFTAYVQKSSNPKIIFRHFNQVVSIYFLCFLYLQSFNKILVETLSLNTVNKNKLLEKTKEMSIHLSLYDTYSFKCYYRDVLIPCPFSVFSVIIPAMVVSGDLTIQLWILLRN